MSSTKVFAENAVVIRPAQRADFNAIAALHAASWKDAYRGLLSDAYLAGQVGIDLGRRWSQLELKGDDFVLVAEAEGKIIGFLMMWVRDGGYLDNLHVHPTLRSSGIGVKLLRAAALKLDELGHRTFYLWVLEENIAARRFYERHGGQVIVKENREIFDEVLPHLKISWDGPSYAQLV